MALTCHYGYNCITVDQAVLCQHFQNILLHSFRDQKSSQLFWSLEASCFFLFLMLCQERSEDLFPVHLRNFNASTPSYFSDEDILLQRNTIHF